jgi:predicted nucleic acid-binding protein
MNGSSFLVDTNIALYLLSGNTTIAEILDGSQLYTSFVTQLELLGYKGITSKELTSVKLFLNDCIIIDINKEIKKHTVAIKKNIN